MPWTGLAIGILGVFVVAEVPVGGNGGQLSGGVGPAGTASQGDRVIELCCAWNRNLDDGHLTFAFTPTDAATTKVMRAAVGAWDDALPELTLTEVRTDDEPDITITYTGPDTERTHGQAVSYFDRRGFTRRVEITVAGDPAPGNTGALDQITKHEFGHALGIGHARFADDLMSPAVNPDPAPIPACNLAAVRQANHWKFVEGSDRPRMPSVKRIACDGASPVAPPR